MLLVYPMLDDRNTVPDPLLAPTATWTYEQNATGWGCLLGEPAGDGDVPGYAAPTRAAGLPATYIDVGGLDIFRDEDLTFAARLARAGVEVEFHLYPGVPHLFEDFAPEAGVTQRAMAARVRFLSRLSQ